MIFIIDDDEIMRECIARVCSKYDVSMFSDAISAMQKIASGTLPDLIFIDVMLTGPDGFTFLNELLSYTDTAKIPVVIVTALEMPKADLSTYGVVGVLNKEKMTPKDIKEYVKKYAK
jgi:CheY-like chemotaxis protein